VISLETWSEILQLENVCLSCWKLCFLELNIGSGTVYPDIRCVVSWFSSVRPSIMTEDYAIEP